ncbi:MAG TPA: CPBP family intramembrane glutamic endopeptidase [Thermoanaerobaculia bacterium]|jgi:membrane protease YdiL (CAAX protease family)
MDANLIDHLLFLLMALALPIEARREYRRLLAKASPQARRRAWKLTIAGQWGLSLGLIAWWLYQKRPLPSLGLAPIAGGAGSAFAIGAALVAVGFLVWQLVAVRKGGAAREALRSQIAPVEALLPHDAPELRLFMAVAVTAGICEELLYRGFMFWYLERLGGTVLAVVVSALLFGVAHVYQGVSGLWKAGIAGLATAGLRVLTGSLWVPMVLHGAVDVLGGLTAREALEPAPPQSDREATPAAP